MGTLVHGRQLHKCILVTINLPFSHDFNFEELWLPACATLYQLWIVRYPNKPVFARGLDDERVGTVLSGTLLVGYGDRFDETNMKALGPGGVWTEPPRQPHYVWAKDGDVIIQVVGFGPSGTTAATEGSR